MKKILMLFVLVVAFATTNAQKPVQFGGTVSNPTNAITSATSDTMYLTISNAYNVHGIQLTKKTGTTVTATSYVSVSYDGTNYINTDTISVASGALVTYKIEKSNPVAYKYRIISVGGGSGSGTLEAWLMARRYF